VASRVLTHAMVLTAVLAWGLNPMVMKLGLRQLAPHPFNTLRLLIGILLTAPVLLLSGSWKPLKRADILRLFALPAIGFIVFQFFFTFGVAASSASVAAIILGILPICVALISYLFRIEPLTGMKVSGIAVTFSGVVLIALGAPAGLDVQGTQAWGVLLLVICEIAYGLYTVFLKPLTRRYPVPQIVFLMMCTAFVPFALYTFSEYGIPVYADLTPLTLGSAFFSGFFALAVANFLWSMGVIRLGSVNTSVYGNLQPAFGVAAGMIVLKESLTLIQLAGAGAVLVGIMLVNRRKRREAAV
jgi:drug/metabolite transporter (DMT)-like permease